jgi:hypothetical protein
MTALIVVRPDALAQGGEHLHGLGAPCNRCWNVGQLVTRLRNSYVIDRVIACDRQYPGYAPLSAYAARR